ncbi:MAG: heme-binding protein [Bryobacteraceae bacterium]
MKLSTSMTRAMLLALGGLAAYAQETNACKDLPSQADLRTALVTAQAQKNGGLGFHMWATLVNRDGVVCAVAFSGADRGDQWPGSRVISAQKANTANSFSLPGFALSTANLYTAVQPGGTLFGLQDSNPVNTLVGYDGKSEDIGTDKDPMVGKKVGGINVFGGGLALYAQQGGKILGGVGVSGDTSCADHNIAWKVRDLLALDRVPAGVAGTGRDNIIYDLAVDTVTRATSSPSGYGHPVCSADATSIGNNLPALFPTGL